MISIAIADDHPVVLNGIEQVLRAERDFRVVASCTDGEQALTAVVQKQPDVLILDLRMPRRDGLNVLRELTARNIATKVILLTASLNVGEIRRAVLLGASGVILKDAAVHLLVSCIRTVAAGERWLDATNLKRLLNESATTDQLSLEVTSKLNEKEIETFFMLSCRMPEEEIARATAVSEMAVHAQVERIYRKLGVQSSSELGQFIFDDSERAAAARIPIASEVENGQIRRLQKQFGLTPREASVSILLAQGFSNKEIADRLNITINTVKTHVAAIHAKAEVSSTRKLLVVLRSSS
jgi:two-component system nitrate/nitrite response regulator NarL